MQNNKKNKLCVFWLLLVLIFSCKGTVYVYDPTSKEDKGQSTDETPKNSNSKSPEVKPYKSQIRSRSSSLDKSNQSHIEHIDSNDEILTTLLEKKNRLKTKLQNLKSKNISTNDIEDLEKTKNLLTTDLDKKTKELDNLNTEHNNLSQILQQKSNSLKDLEKSNEKENNITNQKIEKLNKTFKSTKKTNALSISKIEKSINQTKTTFDKLTKLTNLTAKTDYKSLQKHIANIEELKLKNTIALIGPCSAILDKNMRNTFYSEIKKMINKSNDKKDFKLKDAKLLLHKITDPNIKFNNNFNGFLKKVAGLQNIMAVLSIKTTEDNDTVKMIVFWGETKEPRMLDPFFIFFYKEEIQIVKKFPTNNYTHPVPLHDSTMLKFGNEEFTIQNKTSQITIRFYITAFGDQFFLWKDIPKEGNKYFLSKEKFFTSDNKNIEKLEFYQVEFTE